MKDKKGRREQYPAAPEDVAERNAWFAERNKRLQEKGIKRGPNAPADGTFGGVRKAP